MAIVSISMQIETPEGGQSEQLTISETAAEAVRLSFNPSALPRVNRLKALAAAFLSEVDAVAAEKPEASRELDVARMHMQTASMWAVLGATKGV